MENPITSTSHRSSQGVFSHRSLRKASAVHPVITGLAGSAGIAGRSLTVVGEISQEGPRSGFLWTPERGLATLGTLPGDFSSSLHGVNSAGVAVGNSTGPNFPLGLHATRCDRQGCVDLNTLVDAPDWRLEYAESITDQGVIGSMGQHPNIRAFLLRPLR